MTQVHRDRDRVWLEGVRGWSWRDKRSSIHAAQAAVMQAGAEMFVETAWGWRCAVFTARKAEPPDRRTLAGAALRQAVHMASAGEAGGYFVGFEAWRQYIARLGRLEDADDRTRKEALIGNAWIYACLAHRRACAASYLRDVQREFAGPAAERLNTAASLYERMATHILRDERQAITGSDQPPWRQRQEQIQRLQDALPLERQAIAEIEQAITIAAEKPPAAHGASGAEWSHR